MEWFIKIFREEWSVISKAPVTITIIVLSTIGASVWGTNIFHSIISKIDDNIVREKDSTIEKKDTIIQSKDSTIQEKETIIQKKDIKIQELETQIEIIGTSTVGEEAQRQALVKRFATPDELIPSHLKDKTIRIVDLTCSPKTDPVVKLV